MRLPTVAPALLMAVAVAGAQTAESGREPELVAQRDAELSFDQMATQVSKALVQMEQGASSVRQQLEQARAGHDVVKVLCLNDKLNQIDVAVRSATDHKASFDAALTRKDRDRAHHEYTVIQVLRDRARSLVSEANQCIGEEVGFVGEASVTVEVDSTIPEDPSGYPEDSLISTPPTVASRVD